MSSLLGVASSSLDASIFDAAFVNAGLRVFIALVLTASGVGKYWDRAGARQAMLDFGVADRWAPRAALALPAWELLLALGLLSDRGARAAAYGTAVLMGLLALALMDRLRRREHPDCHCFGALHSAPISWTTVLRAVLLGIIAALSAELPLFGLTSNLARSALTLCGFALVALALSAKLRPRTSTVEEERGLLVGQPLPHIKLSGDCCLQQVLPANRRALLVLLSTGSDACEAVEGILPQWVQRVSESIAILQLKLGQDYSLTPSADWQFSLSGQEFSKFRAGTPSAFLIDRSGALERTPAAGIAEIEALLESSVAKAHTG